MPFEEELGSSTIQCDIVNIKRQKNNMFKQLKGCCKYNIFKEYAVSVKNEYSSFDGSCEKT